MAETVIERAVANAEIDGDGRLVAADPALLTLNARAGGAIGAPLAVPQLATVVRIARRLGIVVTRRVLVADTEADIQLWVRAQPDGAGIRIAASGWHERQPWAPVAGLPVHAYRDFTGAEDGWRWETDAGLRLTFLPIDHAPGFDTLALLGEPLTRLFRLGSDDVEDLPILEALARRKPFSGQPARLRSDNAPVLLSATIRLDAEGGFAGFQGVARPAEEPGGPPPRARTELSAQFTEGLDKALRAPLGRIVANADSINAQAEGPVDPAYSDYAADIANAGRHLLGLIDDLVDLQAIERADFRLAVEPIDLADVARRAVGLLAVRAGNAEVAIVRPRPDAVLPALGEFRRTLQILLNLIGNAIRYAPAGSLVTVATGEDAASVSITVADTGKGIAPEDQARIFEKFARVDTSEPGGNGLGLYIARRLARAMGGDLSVESAAGMGARFTLTLPRA
jgi:signal transduction histidine kinase